MIALWFSWCFLLAAIIVAYVLLMRQQRKCDNFVQMDAEGARIPVPWYEGKRMLWVIQGLLACSAFSLLLHFALPGEGPGLVAHVEMDGGGAGDRNVTGSLG
jgi:hypothetical protein